ncbi:hypothetical protein TYRP_020147 [Tyrophagus putrescentiae]|nr:hypothetical protein TYRP_020147 [Tyrophagus putrescentiae]
MVVGREAQSSITSVNGSGECTYSLPVSSSNSMCPSPYSYHPSITAIGIIASLAKSAASGVLRPSNQKLGGLIPRVMQCYA